MSEQTGPPWDHRTEADRLAENLGVPRWDTPPRLVLYFLPEHTEIDRTFTGHSPDIKMVVRDYGVRWAGSAQGYVPAYADMAQTKEGFWVGVPADTPTY